VKFDINS